MQVLVEAHCAICRPPGTRRLPSRPSSAARGAVEVLRIGDDLGGAPEVKRVAANRPPEDCFRALAPCPSSQRQGETKRSRAVSTVFCTAGGGTGRLARGLNPKRGAKCAY